MSKPADRVEDLLKTVATALDLKAEIVMEDRDGVIHAEVVAEDMGLFIGRHGSTIDAVQHLAQRIASAGEENRVPVVVDGAGYRAKREEALCGAADRAAGDAERFKRPVAMDAMSPPERKIVHEYLRDRGGVETHSEGEGADRHLVVSPTVV